MTLFEAKIEQQNINSKNWLHPVPSFAKKSVFEKLNHPVGTLFAKPQMAMIKVKRRKN